MAERHKVLPITDAHYERIRKGLRTLQGGGLGRWGFYHQIKDVDTGATYRDQACYASLCNAAQRHFGEVLYVGFNPYNEPSSSASHHRTGKGKAASAYAKRVELEWLKMLVGKHTPFPNVIAHLHQTNPSIIHSDGGFIFKDMSKLPNAEFNCFIICARLCYEDGPSMDTFLWLRDHKHTLRLSALMATGMRPKSHVLSDDEVKKPWELFSPSHTYIGGDITGYAYRWLYARPERSSTGLGNAYGTADIYAAGSVNLYGPGVKKVFDGGVAECIKHLKDASEEQRKKLGDRK